MAESKGGITPKFHKVLATVDQGGGREVQLACVMWPKATDYKFDIRQHWRNSDGELQHGKGLSVDLKTLTALGLYVSKHPKTLKKYATGKGKGQKK